MPNLQGEDLELTLAVKNSHFIANLRHTIGRGECDIHLNDMRKKYPDASHHCWAVVADAPDNSTFWGLSDAGEPSGTAGKPMLQVLSHCGIGEVSVVVCRYFGGTKLGTGGLVKAYTDAVKLVVEACPRQTKRQLKHISLACPYDLMGRIEHLCQRHDAVIQQRDYGDSLTLALLIPVKNIPALEQDLGPLAHAYIMPAL
ncbi:YigZ family protein [Oceanospirillaceae bacterium]|nr:YigZ family protein [Oceanospirillaceae bacterium]MDC1341230.1 YigZ family protein [Oceanospirillaceae bacterium]